MKKAQRATTANNEDPKKPKSDSKKVIRIQFRPSSWPQGEASKRISRWLEPEAIAIGEADKAKKLGCI